MRGKLVYFTLFLLMFTIEFLYYKFKELPSEEQTVKPPSFEVGVKKKQDVPDVPRKVYDGEERHLREMFDSSKQLVLSESIVYSDWVNQTIGNGQTLFLYSAYMVIIIEVRIDLQVHIPG